MEHWATSFVIRVDDPPRYVTGYRLHTCMYTALTALSLHAALWVGISGSERGSEYN